MLNPAVDQFLGSFDFGYQRRRLRFLVDGVISLYPGNARRDGVPLDLPTRSQLDAAKQLLYAGIAVIDGTYDVVGQNAAILAGVLELFPDTISNTILGPPDWPPRGKLKQEAIASMIADDQFGALIRSVRQQLSDALPGDPPKPSFDAYSESVFDDLVELIGGAESGDPPGWPDPAWHEDRFRSRFDFFERWDRVVYPIQRAFQVGEHDVVTLARMSPLDATLLAPPGGDPEERDSFYKNKLKGTRFNHFGAFLEPAWRQGDYLWGRLDAAERLVRLLVNDPKDSETVTSFCNRLFPAILSEEEPVLREATDVIELVSSRLPLA
jgi:hypothetical protein